MTTYNNLTATLCVQVGTRFKQITVNESAQSSLENSDADHSTMEHSDSRIEDTDPKTCSHGSKVCRKPIDDKAVSSAFMTSILCVFKLQCHDLENLDNLKPRVNVLAYGRQELKMSYRLPNWDHACVV